MLVGASFIGSVSWRLASQIPCHAKSSGAKHLRGLRFINIFKKSPSARLDRLARKQYQRIANRRMIVGGNEVGNSHFRIALGIGCVDDTRFGLTTSDISKGGPHVLA